VDPRGIVRTLGLLTLAVASCAAPRNAERYRLSASGEYWDVVGEDRVFEDVEHRYPEFFAVVLDPSRTHDPDLRPLRNDLERKPVDRRNYDALNAVAIGYFELNYRAQADPGGARYLADSLRAAQLLAVPWRAYGEIDDGALRDAILDFFQDAASGEKLETRGTAGRLGRVVESLAHKESDPTRRARIEAMAARIEAEAGEPE
jgi:hypothetical protein